MMILYYDDQNCSVKDNDYNRIAYVYLIQVFIYLFYFAKEHICKELC